MVRTCDNSFVRSVRLQPDREFVRGVRLPAYAEGSARLAEARFVREGWQPDRKIRLKADPTHGIWL
jgi:hypothetical protein